MKRLTLEEIKKIELDILVLFDEYCKQNGFCYSLGAGTLLGAARHRGFIPWDDDIDLFMNRNDYDRFIRSLPQNGILDDRFKVLVPDKCEKYFYPFIKIVDTRTIVYEKNIAKEYEIGVWIDLFPVDYCAEDRDTARKICKNRYKKIKKYLYYFYDLKEKSLKRMLQRLYVKFINTWRKKQRDRIKKELMKPTGKDGAAFMGTICWTFSQNDAYPSSYFDEYAEIEFEGRKFPVYKRYKDILQYKYGDDYMEIPPLEKQISHNPEAYFL